MTGRARPAPRRFLAGLGGLVAAALYAACCLVYAGLTTVAVVGEPEAFGRGTMFALHLAASGFGMVGGVGSFERADPIGFGSAFFPLPWILLPVGLLWLVLSALRRWLPSGWRAYGESAAWFAVSFGVSIGVGLAVAAAQVAARSDRVVVSVDSWNVVLAGVGVGLVTAALYGKRRGLLPPGPLVGWTRTRAVLRAASTGAAVLVVAAAALAIPAYAVAVLRSGTTGEALAMLASLPYLGLNVGIDAVMVLAGAGVDTTIGSVLIGPPPDSMPVSLDIVIEGGRSEVDQLPFALYALLPVLGAVAAARALGRARLQSTSDALRRAGFVVAGAGVAAAAFVVLGRIVLEAFFVAAGAAARPILSLRVEPDSAAVLQVVAWAALGAIVVAVATSRRRRLPWLAPVPLAAPSSRRFCTACGAATDPGRKFCVQCGHATGV